MEITRRSKLLDVLKAYPFLEDQIVDIAPPFKNLRNPVLRRTVGQLATIEQVAQIGHLDVVELVNTLRRSAGQGDAAAEMEREIAAPATAAGDPAWIKGRPQFVVDGNALLAQGEVPLEQVNQLLGRLEAGGYVLVVTDFEPSPIIGAMRLQGRGVYHRVDSEASGQHYTYVRLTDSG